MKLFNLFAVTFGTARRDLGGLGPVNSTAMYGIRWQYPVIKSKNLGASLGALPRAHPSTDSEPRLRL